MAPRSRRLDGGPNWEADQEANLSQYLDAAYTSQAAAQRKISPGTAVPNATVPSTTPAGVFDVERWDPDTGLPMEWNFPVPVGDTVEVRLYMGNAYGPNNTVGARAFDVSIDGELVLDDYDPVASTGASGTNFIAEMQSFVVTSDGTIDVDFAQHRSGQSRDQGHRDRRTRRRR